MWKKKVLPSLISKLILSNGLILLKQGTEVQEYDDALVRRLVETITVYDDRFKVKFKSGIEIEVAA